MASYKAQRDELFGVPSDPAPQGGNQAKSGGRGPVASGVSAKSNRPASNNSQPLPARASSAPSAAPKAPTDLEKRQKAEADAMASEAQKLITKPRFGLFWSPEHRRAATEFEKAATKLQVARFMPEAVAMLERAVESHLAEGYVHPARVALERAANLCLKQQRVSDAAKFYQRVADLHMEALDYQRAADALCAGAKALAAAGDASGCLALYHAACAIVYDGDEPVDQVAFKATAHETFEQAVEWCLTSSSSPSLLKEAQSLLPRLVAVARANGVEGSVNKALLTEAILVISDGDLVRAQELFMQHLSDAAYLRSNECKCEEDLLASLRRRDPPSLAEAQKSACLNYLPRSVKALALAFEVEGAAEEEEEEEEDEDEEDLDLQASASDQPSGKGAGAAAVVDSSAAPLVPPPVPPPAAASVPAPVAPSVPATSTPPVAPLAAGVEAPATANSAPAAGEESDDDEDGDLDAMVAAAKLDAATLAPPAAPTAAAVVADSSSAAGAPIDPTTDDVAVAESSVSSKSPTAESPVAAEAAPEHDASGKVEDDDEDEDEEEDEDLT